MSLAHVCKYLAVLVVASYTCGLGGCNREKATFREPKSLLHQAGDLALQYGPGVIMKAAAEPEKVQEIVTKAKSGDP